MPWEVCVLCREVLCLLSCFILANLALISGDQFLCCWRITAGAYQWSQEGLVQYCRSLPVITRGTGSILQELASDHKRDWFNTAGACQ
jgi:hypothetical protein